MERHWNKDVFAVGPKRRRRVFDINRNAEDKGTVKKTKPNQKTFFNQKEFLQAPSKEMQQTKQIVILSDQQTQSKQVTQKSKKSQNFFKNSLSQRVNINCNVEIQPVGKQVIQIRNGKSKEKKSLQNASKSISLRKKRKPKSKQQKDQRLQFVLQDEDSKFPWLNPKLGAIFQEQQSQVQQKIKSKKERVVAIKKNDGVKLSHTRKNKQQMKFRRMMIKDLLFYMPVRKQNGKNIFNTAVQVDKKGQVILDWQIFVKVTSVWENRGVRKFMAIDEQGTQIKCEFQKDARHSYDVNFITKGEFYTMSKGFICFDPQVQAIKSISLNRKAIICNIRVPGFEKKKFNLNRSKTWRIDELPEKIGLIRQGKIANEVNVIGIVRDMERLQASRKGRIKMYKVILCDFDSKMEIQVNLLFQLNTFEVLQVMHLHLFKVVENPGGIMALTTDRISFYTIQTDRSDQVVEPFIYQLEKLDRHSILQDYQFDMIRRAMFPQRTIFEILSETTKGLFSDQLVREESSQVDVHLQLLNQIYQQIGQPSIMKQSVFDQRGQLVDKGRKRDKKELVKCTNELEKTAKSVILSTVRCQEIKLSLSYFADLKSIPKEKSQPSLILAQDRPSRYASQIKKSHSNMASHFNIQISIDDDTGQLHNLQISMQQARILLNLSQKQLEGLFDFQGQLSQIERLEKIEQLKVNLNQRVKEINRKNKILVQIRSTAIEQHKVESIEIKQRQI